MQDHFRYLCFEIFPMAFDLNKVYPLYLFFKHLRTCSLGQFGPILPKEENNLVIFCPREKLI
jgi:hypothetical protein